MERKELIRIIYLYLFSLLGLILIISGAVRLVDLGLKTWIFKKADQVILYPELRVAKLPSGSETKAEELTLEEQERFRQEQFEYQQKEQAARKERAAANSLAMIIVGVPLFAYHWRLIQKGKLESKN